MRSHKLIIAGCLLLFCGTLLFSKTQTLTLLEALQMAAQQNPDILLARLDAVRDQENVGIARDPFRPKLSLGSDPVWTYGYPNSIASYPTDTGTHSPSIGSARIDMDLLNLHARYTLAASEEQARSAHLLPEQKTDEIAYQVASLYFDAQQRRRKVQALQQQIAALNEALRQTEVRVNEQTDLPVELKRAKVNLLQSQQALHVLQAAEEDGETQLAMALGLSAQDCILPVEKQTELKLPISSDEEAVKIAIENSKELFRLQSSVLAKQLETRSYRSTRLPLASLVAQYSYFAKRNYQDYFPSNKFQPNNAQIGASLALPLLIGSAPAAQADQAQTDLLKLRLQIDQTRNRIASDTQHSYMQFREAETLLALARQRLNITREDVAAQKSRYQENLLSLNDLRLVETTETNQLLAFYENEAAFEKAKLGVLRQLGNLMAVLQGRQ